MPCDGFVMSVIQLCSYLDLCSRRPEDDDVSTKPGVRRKRKVRTVPAQAGEQVEHA